MARLTPGELHVMKLLWAHGEMKPGEIQNLYPGDIKNAALRSYLSILMDKGHVSRRKVGKAFFYKPLTRKKSAMKSTLRNVIDTFCGGSTRELILSLIRSEKMSDEDLLELKRLAESGGAVESSPANGTQAKSRKTVTKKKPAKKKPAKKKSAGGRAIGKVSGKATAAKSKPGKRSRS